MSTGLITIDLSALQANWRALSDLVKPATCSAVVKADAYGLGAQRVIPALCRAGCRVFFVATPEEAVSARAMIGDATLYALDGVPLGLSQMLRIAGAIPVISTLDELDEWIAAHEASARAPVALHIDSGLNRLGLEEEDIDQLAADPARLARLSIKLVMSHLASADDPKDPKSDAQRQRFESLRAKLPQAPASLAASDGLMLGAPFHFDMVRPGYALYGGQAFQGGRTPVEPVVRLEARILQVRNVAVGETVGYSGTWTAQRPSRIAIIAAGYADGFARTASAGTGAEGGIVLIGGVRAPVVGRVSMDLITVDVTDLSAQPKRGDIAVVIGDGLTLEDVGRAAHTIGYEVLTRLGHRFDRAYVDGTR